MYEVSIHEHGRKMVRSGPAEGLLDWPTHRWTRINRRPLGLAKAKALADEQSGHAVVTIWMSAEKAYDNGKAPLKPADWWPASANSALEPRDSRCCCHQCMARSSAAHPKQYRICQAVPGTDDYGHYIEVLGTDRQWYPEFPTSCLTSWGPVQLRFIISEV